jgi:hypothetical protein
MTVSTFWKCPIHFDYSGAVPCPKCDGSATYVVLPADGGAATSERVGHYATPTGVEASDVIDAYGLNFNLGCVVKYVCRCDRKGDPVGDLQKAADYLARELKRRKAG